MLKESTKNQYAQNAQIWGCFLLKVAHLRQCAMKKSDWTLKFDEGTLQSNLHIKQNRLSDCPHPL